MSLIELVFEFHRGLIAQRAVEPPWVIKGFDIIKGLEPGLGPGGGSLFKAFGFQGGKKRFRQGVVPLPAPKPASKLPSALRVGGPLAEGRQLGRGR